MQPDPAQAERQRQAAWLEPKTFQETGSVNPADRKTVNSKPCTSTLKPESRYALAFLACLGPFGVFAPTPAAAEARAQILDTPSFTIRIEVKCPEGEVSCENVIYRGVNKRTKKTLHLRGQTAHSICADGVTPCRFLGYIFRKGTFTYFVSEGGELVVTDGGKVVVQQSGAWQ